MSFSNLGNLSDAQSITQAAASTNYIDLATIRQQIGVGVPIYLCIKNNTVNAQAADTVSIELQNDDVNTFNSACLYWTVFGGAAGAELAASVTRLATAGKFLFRGTIPYECSKRYLRLYYNNSTSNGTFVFDAWLSLLPPSDIGNKAQVWSSPVGNP